MTRSVSVQTLDPAPTGLCGQLSPWASRRAERSAKVGAVVRDSKQAGTSMHAEAETLSYESPAIYEIGSIADLTQGNTTAVADITVTGSQ
jgi:hypothetical protein